MGSYESQRFVAVMTCPLFVLFFLLKVLLLPLKAGL